MADKYQEYYSLVDIYEKKKDKSLLFNEDNDSQEAQLFKLFPPISIAVLMSNLEIIINKLCQELVSKKSVEEEIENIKKGKKSDNYRWKKFNLSDLFIGDYNYLKNLFLFNEKLVPNKNYYINKYIHPLDNNYKYLFSLKELFHVLLLRAINLLIKNYFI